MSLYDSHAMSCFSLEYKAYSGDKIKQQAQEQDKEDPFAGQAFGDGEK